MLQYAELKIWGESGVLQRSAGSPNAKALSIYIAASIYQWRQGKWYTQ